MLGWLEPVIPAMKRGHISVNIWPKSETSLRTRVQAKSQEEVAGWLKPYHTNNAKRVFLSFQFNFRVTAVYCSAVQYFSP